MLNAERRTAVLECFVMFVFGLSDRHELELETVEKHHHDIRCLKHLVLDYINGSQHKLLKYG
jgi:hypothetical protein